MEIATEIGISKEDIVFAMDAIQSPVSLYEPVYTEGGDTLCIMDQVSDKKNDEDTWVEHCAERSNETSDGSENNIIKMRFYQGKTQMEVARELEYPRHRFPESKKMRKV